MEQVKTIVQHAYMFNVQRIDRIICFPHQPEDFENGDILFKEGRGTVVFSKPVYDATFNVKTFEKYVSYEFSNIKFMHLPNVNNDGASKDIIELFYFIFESEDTQETLKIPCISIKPPHLVPNPMIKIPIEYFESYGIEELMSVNFNNLSIHIQQSQEIV